MQDPPSRRAELAGIIILAVLVGLAVYGLGHIITAAGICQ